METHLHLPRWERREPDWAAAAVAGFAAGAILMVLELAWTGVTRPDALWRTSQLVAALTMGPGFSLQGSPLAFDWTVVAVALATHYGLGTAFGLVLGIVLAGFHIDTSMVRMQVLGALFGLALYLVNFYVVAGAFPWFAELRGWSTLIAHLVFGVSASLLYWKLARRPADSSDRA